jgi:tetratricopeptide (TPR) repeat protein
VEAPRAPAKRLTIEEARHLLEERQIPAAEHAFTQLLGSAADRGPASTGLARCAFERGDYAEAIRRAERAVKSGGGAQAHLVLGDAYFKVLKFDFAVREYREVLKVQPGSSEAKQHLEAAQRRASGG